MNAVSVVNLITAIGFAVEFCIHTLLKYQKSRGTKVQRIKKAINQMGSSVFSGVFITKLLGIFFSKILKGFLSWASPRVQFSDFTISGCISSWFWLVAFMGWLCCQGSSSSLGLIIWLKRRFWKLRNWKGSLVKNLIWVGWMIMIKLRESNLFFFKGKNFCWFFFYFYGFWV